MRRLGLHLFVPALLAAACSAPRDRAECSASAPCGAGEYCAHTPDGSICWPDAVAPVVQGVTVTCGTPCLRDGTLQVSATVTDDQELASVEASIPTLSGTRTVTMTESSGKWVAVVPLVEWPFPAFEAPVAVRVTAKDAAQNAAQLDAAGGNVPVVTRLRWTVPLETQTAMALTAAAVADSGNIVVGGNNGKLYFVSASGEPVRDPLVVGGALTAAPSIASNETIWVGSQDGTLYSFTQSGVSAGSTCVTGEPIHAPAAVAGSRAIAGSQAGILEVGGPDNLCVPNTAAGPVVQGPVVAADGTVYFATDNALNSYSILPLGNTRDNWTGVEPWPARPILGGTVGTGLVLDRAGAIVSLSTSGSLDRTTAAAVTSNITTVARATTSPVILSDGSIIVGTAATTSGVLKRIADHTPPWTDSATVNGVPAIPLVLDADEPTLLVPTSTGRLYAVKTADGTIAWSVKLSSTGQPLQPANIFTAPGATTSTAYIGGADGKLYAVIVDGRLDTAAPWPKAFHDPRNTSNAGVAP